MYRNASGRTGAFCTIQACLDQVREEQGANVLQNFIQLSINRTNVVDTPVSIHYHDKHVTQHIKMD